MVDRIYIPVYSYGEKWNEQKKQKDQQYANCKDQRWKDDREDKYINLNAYIENC